MTRARRMALVVVALLGASFAGCSSAAPEHGDAGADLSFSDAGPADADAAPATSDAAADAAAACGPCRDYWICGGSVSEIDLVPEADGCYLMGLPGRKLLAADGTITEDGAVIGHADGTGARVTVVDAAGMQWLFCAGTWTCKAR